MVALPPDQHRRRHRLRSWVETRWPLTAVMHWASNEEIPGGSKFSYVLGSSTLALFAILAITGVWQMLYYVPTVDHAYASVMFLRLQVPLGWLVHGLHYWAAQAFIVVMGLHVVRVFIWAAYKKPRELTWLLGVVLLVLGAAFVFTGALLPWDNLGYWAGGVGTNMAGTVPFIGGFLKLLMRGGDSMGQMTLSRAFTVHVEILPVLTTFFIVVHLVAFRQFGSVGPWIAKRQRTGSFWPDQAFKDLLVVSLIMMGLFCLSAYVRAPISGPADPLDSTYTPKPEWNFLFLYEALKAFKGRWEWVGTVVIPSVLILLLFAVPFIDRSKERNPFKRPIAMVAAFLFVSMILTLTVIGYRSTPSGSAPAPSAIAATTTTPAASPTAAEATAAAPKAPVTGTVAANHAPAASIQSIATPSTGTQPTPAVGVTDREQGAAIFASVGCVACHAIHGNGGTLGPNLSFESQLGRTRRWLVSQIHDPIKHVSSSIMPAYQQLTEAQIRSLTDFILAPPPGPGSAPHPSAGVTVTAAATSSAELPSPPAAPTASQSTSTDGKALFTAMGCAVCHRMDGAGGVVGPDLSHEASLGRSESWLVTQITAPSTHAAATRMPTYQSLNQTQLTSLINYIKKSTAAPAPPVAVSSPSPSPAPTPSPVSAPSSTPPSNSATANTTPSPDDAAPPSVAAMTMIGDPQHGAVLFANECASCHGAEGAGHVVNPGSLAGVVSPLAPIARWLYRHDAAEFTSSIDRFIQHGAAAPGIHPSLVMPAFGDTHTLTPPMIANIEAYVLSLNGVDAAAIVHPGITPTCFVTGSGLLLAMAMIAIFILWMHTRPRSQDHGGPSPHQHKIMGLQQKIMELTHQLEEEQRKREEE